jgi:hypothetical protein
MPSRSLVHAAAAAVLVALLAVSCSSGTPKERASEGTGDAGSPTTGPTTDDLTQPTPEPPTGAPTPVTPPPTSGPGGHGGGGDGIFLTEGGTYQITSDRMIYVAKQRFLVVTPKLWFGQTPTPKFPKGAYLATDTGAFLSSGGTWTNASSRTLKDDLEPVDTDAVLRAVARLPISTWHYRSEAVAVRHLGPMAEDFSRLFHLGQDDRHIATVDEEGVALAAIKALSARSAGQSRTIASLKSRLAARSAKVAALGRSQRRMRRQLEQLAAEVRRLANHR